MIYLLNTLEKGKYSSYNFVNVFTINNPKYVENKYILVLLMQVILYINVYSNTIEWEIFPEDIKYIESLPDVEDIHYIIV